MDKNLKRLFRKAAAVVGIGACIGLAAATSARAQAWQAVYGLGSDEDAGRGGVIAQPDGKIVAAGQAKFLGRDNIFVVKTNGCYTAEWTKHYDLGGDEVAHKIRATPDGGYIVVGTANNELHCRKLNDIFLLKLDASGTVQWAKTYGGDGMEEGWDVQVGSNYFVVAGSTTSYGMGGREAFLMKTDLSGNVIWSNAQGNVGNEYYLSCAIGANGDIYATGVRGSVIYLARYNSSGGLYWTYYGGGSNAVGWKIIECSNGDIAIAGSAADYNGKISGYLIRMQNTAAYITDRVYGSTSGGVDEFHDMVEIPNGHLLVTGTVSNPSLALSGPKMYVGDFDASLLLFGDRVHGGTKQEEGWGIAYVQNFAAAPEYATVGASNSFSSGINDLYLVRSRINSRDNCADYTIDQDMNGMQPVYGFNPVYDIWTWLDMTGCSVNVTTREEGTTTLVCSNCISKPMLGQTGAEAPEDGGSIQAYPNPVRSGQSLKLRVADPASGKAGITVSDLTGTVIHSGEGDVSGGEVAVATDGWADGVYLIRVKIGETLYNSRVVVGGK